MNEKCITSLHIQKLGHELQEIRERALLTIISKLEHGFQFDNDLARTKELLTKLFDWFLFEPCTKQQVVFSLIKRILQSESGRVLLNHHGTSTFKKDLKQIRTYIEPKYYPHLEEILQILDDKAVIVPPLETDVPLSYRTGQSEFSSRPVGTTATTIECYVRQESSVRPHDTPDLAIIENNTPLSYIIHPLKWQSLIEADRQVLQSIEDSLKVPPQPASLLHSADFFCNILLRDFPAEVFLQRPNIVICFQDLVVNCPSTRVVNSVFNCLINLSKALRTRINHYNDPCLFTTKEINFSQSRSSTPDSSSRRTGSGRSENLSETYENVNYLKTQQISFPHFCFTSFKCVFKYLCAKSDSFKTVRKKNQRGINLALVLLDELLQLLSMLFDQDIWLENSLPLVNEIRKQMNEILLQYGLGLEYFRIESASDDLSSNNRVIQLCFLHNCANFLTTMIPLTQTGFILPKNLKIALAESLVDVALSKMYPEVYNKILDYVQSFKVGLDEESLVKFSETKRVCESMTSAVKFMNDWKLFNAKEGIDLARKSLPSLEFHRDIRFVNYVIDLCATKLPLYSHNDELFEVFETVLLKLLSHNLEEVKLEAYRLSQRRVIAAIGPKLNTLGSGVPGAQILFLCRSKILIEIGCHGLTSDNPQIRNFSEDILIHLIKCKILVADDIWNKIIEALIVSLPILLTHADKNSSLGKCLLNITDPDTAESLFLPKINVVKANIHILFGNETFMREEAFSRLCWLLATQSDSREMLPRLNNLYDKALPNVCQLQRRLDVNKNRSTQHFYQPSSLQQVLDLLKSSNVEPVIRRSALTQISVMMEDPLLHQIFLNCDGLELILEALKLALIERNYNYPDCAIPCVSILKNICLFQPTARLELCENIDLLFNILRSLFLFFAEEKVRSDAVTLLFLLIFTDFIKGTPTKATLSVPYLVTKKLKVPFTCNTHWEISEYFEPSLVDMVTSDRWCLSSLQIQWNCEILGGLEELLSWKRVHYQENISDILKIKDYDLEWLKASSVDFNIKKYLMEIQNGTMHEAVINSINNLTTYAHLCMFLPKNENFFNHSWETTFTRFLKILPSSEEDTKLLSNILKYLKYLLPFYKSSEEFWLSKIFKNPTNCLLDLIFIDSSTGEDFKILSQDLLSFITLSASQEQHFLDYYIFSYKSAEKSFEPWRNIIEIISKSLKFNDNTHFYNLSYVDNLLSCLVHLTATLGWSKPVSHPIKIHQQLVEALCELIMVFHCGKGSTAAVSVMGLSITRNAVLILNHLTAEMQHCKLKNWEKCFVEIEEEWLKSFLVLWCSRDVLVRAGAVQLFAGLSKSQALASNIVNELKNEKQGVWDLAVTCLLDNEEACIVRENCAYLLGNLMNHNDNSKANQKIGAIFELLEDYQFYKSVAVILSRLYTVNVSCEVRSAANLREEDSLSSGSDINLSIVTPSFVRSIAVMLLSLLNLNEELSHKLQDFGIVKMLFRCICNSSIAINDTKKLSLYCDILEMDAAICVLLGHLAQTNVVCLGTLLHTKDCLTVMVSLLNTHLYHTDLPQLIYLRNKLWSEIFKILATLATDTNNEALTILSEVIEDTGREAFLESVCEATKNIAFNDLQNSALLSLTTMLGAESQRSRDLSSSSMQSLLDTVRSSPKGEATFGGAEICKILLNLYDLCNLKVSKDLLKKKSIITSSLTSILCVSKEAKRFAFGADLTSSIMRQIKEFCVKLSLESVDSLRRVLEKKRVCPVLKDLNELIGLTTNFMVGDELIKNRFVEMGLSDFVHKLFVWFSLQNHHLRDVLRMLCTFTTDCIFACQSLTLTSSVAGSGPRKVPSKISLLNVVVNLVEKEMELVSRTHNLDILELCFDILKNCCCSLECRILVCKTTLLHNLSRLHPAITKKQKPWDFVERFWLEFLQIFTLYPEGQSNVAKINDVFDLLIILATSSKPDNRSIALMVLRNTAFYQPNRSRLLNCDDFLNLMKIKLENGNYEERFMIVLMMWSLAANNQKAKIVFKAAKLDAILQQVLKHYQLSHDFISDDDVNTINYVSAMIRDNEKDC